MRWRDTAAIALLFFCRAGNADETLQQLTHRMVVELRMLDPGAVALWDRANDTAATGDHMAAAARYAELYRRVPKWVHALRREAEEEMLAAQYALALKHAREAVSVDRSADNLATLAQATLIGVVPNHPTPQEIDHAELMAAEAVEKNGLQVLAHGVLAQASMLSHHYSAAERELKRVEEIAPGSASARLLRRWMESQPRP